MSTPSKNTTEHLTEQQYAITQKAATERPFSGPHLQEKRQGTYLCVCCQTALFDSASKFDSGTGWPSFFDCIKSEAATKAHVVCRQDTSHNMTRTEVVCGHCSAHLGHVFDDGPPPTGQRFCINGHALSFQAKDSA